LSPLLLSISYGNQSLLTSKCISSKGIFRLYSHFAILTYHLFSKYNCFSFLCYWTINVTYWLRVPKFFVVFSNMHIASAVHCNNFSVNPDDCSKLLKSVTKSTNPSIESKPILPLNSLSFIM
jgi:hypothetical protein